MSSSSSAPTTGPPALSSSRPPTFTLSLHHPPSTRALSIPELLSLIFACLPQPSLRHVALVNRQWSEIALDAIWRVVDVPSGGVMRLFGLLSEFTTGGVGEEGRRGVEGGAVTTGRRDGAHGRSGFDHNDYLNFASPLTPFSWARFDKYALRVRKLVYVSHHPSRLHPHTSGSAVDSHNANDGRTPHGRAGGRVLSSSAWTQISLTRPRLAILPNMHTLTWSCASPSSSVSGTSRDPDLRGELEGLKWSVLLMHEGIREFQLGIGVRSGGDSDESPEEGDGDDGESESDGDGEDEDRGRGLEHEAAISGIHAYVANIPLRMPNLQTLSVHSHLPVSFPSSSSSPTAQRSTPSFPRSTLTTPVQARTASSQTTLESALASLLSTPLLHEKLKKLVLPRYYSTARLIEAASHMRALEVLEWQYDIDEEGGNSYEMEVEGVRLRQGQGNAVDVRRGRCVPLPWLNSVEDADSDDTTTSSTKDNAEGLFPALNDCSLSATFSDASSILSYPPSSAHPAFVSPSTSSILPYLSLFDMGIDPTPTLMALLSSPTNPTSSTGWPSNLTDLYIDSTEWEAPSGVRAFLQVVGERCRALRRLRVISVRDASGRGRITNSTPGATRTGSTVEILGFRTIAPILHLPLVEFELVHCLPLLLSMEEVEWVARAWKDIEVLILSNDPVFGAVFAEPGFGVHEEVEQAEQDGVEQQDDEEDEDEGGDGDGVCDDEDEKRTILGMEILLPFAKHCRRLKHLGVFLDARSTPELSGLRSLVDIGGTGGSMRTQIHAHSRRSGLGGYYDTDENPFAYPCFESLEKLSMGVSLIDINGGDEGSRSGRQRYFGMEGALLPAVFLSHLLCPPAPPPPILAASSSSLSFPSSSSSQLPLPHASHSHTSTPVNRKRNLKVESGVTWSPAIPILSPIMHAIHARCDAWQKVADVLPLLVHVRAEERERVGEVWREVRELRMRVGVLEDLGKGTKGNDGGGVIGALAGAFRFAK